ncbi:hypothetical protein K9M79_08215 [Candidatus Woesearchaeota archaeon]|nr:hypothetical protein [Candidatus Woesearchaeota archaeon]
MDRLLKLSGYAAVVSALTMLPAFFLSFMGIVSPSPLLKFINLAIIILTLPVAIVIARGYYHLGYLRNVKLLKIMSLVFAILIVFISTYSFVSVFKESYETTYFGIAVIVVLGIAYIIFGSALFRLNKYYGMVPTFLGLLYICEGLFFMSVILFIITPFIGAVSSVLEAILFFKAAKMIEPEDKPKDGTIKNVKITRKKGKTRKKNDRSVKNRDRTGKRNGKRSRRKTLKRKTTIRKNKK